MYVPPHAVMLALQGDKETLVTEPITPHKHMGDAVTVVIGQTVEVPTRILLKVIYEAY